MAQEAGLSRSSFAALFKSVVGEAPLDYLTGWRVYRVKMLLTATDESLLRIANTVGYDNDLSLSRVFKRRTGIAPGKWRQMMKQKGSVQRESALRRFRTRRCMISVRAVEWFRVAGALGSTETCRSSASKDRELEVVGRWLETVAERFPREV